MMPAPFKAGDRVCCIDAAGLEGHVQKGRIYVVESTYVASSTHEMHLRLNSRASSLTPRADRFKLAVPESIEALMKEVE